MTVEMIENTPSAWSRRAEAAATSAEACGWSETGQRERIVKVLAALAPRPGETLLDYGCGTGELARHLASDVDYVGFDPAGGMIVRAQIEHAGRRFQDWEPHPMSADVIACIGCFNLPDRWSKEHTWATLRRLWDGCGRAMAVSLYAGDDERCLSYTHDEVHANVGGLSWDVVVEPWRPNDLLAVVRR